MKTIIHFTLLFFVTMSLSAQNKLIFKTEAVDSLLVWMQNGCDKMNTANIANLPGNQIMNHILSKQEKNIPEFNTILKAFNCNDSITSSPYLLNEAYKKQLEITELLNQIKKSDFSESVYKRAVKYFPDNYIPLRDYEVFFTAVGWQWGDAMSFNYNFTDDKYIVSDTGIPAIIFNLSLVVKTYGNALPEQIKTMKNVMAHELFHAVFSDYTKAHWNQQKEPSFNDELFYLMLNEGLAHYIANGSEIAEVYQQSQSIHEKESNAFNMLYKNAQLLFSDNQTLELRRKTAYKATYGEYWEKYLCITGLFMIYHIEQNFGIEEIKNCVKNGPLYFMQKYEELQRTITELPKLPTEINDYIK